MGQSLVIQVTTEAADVYEPAEQVAVVYDLQPEAVSVSLLELLRPGLSEADLSGFFGWLVETQTMTQVILYDTAEVAQWNQLRARGVIPEGRWFLLFVLGRYAAGQTSSPTDLLPFLQTGDGCHPWSMCAFSAQEYRCAMAALALGGHVRVGFENNLWRRDGTLAPDNASLVIQVAESVALASGRPAGAAQVRQRFQFG